MNHWKDILISTDTFDSATVEQLSEISLAAGCANMTISHSISAIGTVLANAALNEDAGLSNDVVADIGWLLESLGKLSGTLTDRENAATSYIDWHKRQNKEGQ